MVWPVSHTPADAAAPTRHSVSARHSATQTGAASGPAPITAPPPQNGTDRSTTPDLTARAHRFNNRRKDHAERFLRLHRILANPPSFDTEPST